jgi:hypothetical protein
MPFFSRLLPASRLLLRVRLCICRRASAVARWAPSFRMCYPARIAWFRSSRGLSGKTTQISRSGYTRARHRHFLFPVPNSHTEFLTFLRSSPPFFSRSLPAPRLLLRGCFFACGCAYAGGSVR